MCAVGIFYFCFFSSRRRHTRCALVTGVQTCALPITVPRTEVAAARDDGADHQETIAGIRPRTGVRKTHPRDRAQRRHPAVAAAERNLLVHIGLRGLETLQVLQDRDLTPIDVALVLVPALVIGVQSGRDSWGER